jgi:uncharacterized membrane protein HdeD (DUF308 family)
MTMAGSDVAAVRSTASSVWWLWLVTGILWAIVGIMILQFDTTSAATVGVIVGVMFLVAGMQYIFVGTQVDGWAWLWYVFGVILVVGGLVAIFSPIDTFVAIANILGFIFVLVGVMWLIEAFATREGNDLWWMTLIAAILMIGIGFWVSGQLLITKAETLLVFAGVWAMMRGIIDIIASFQIKKLAG